MPNPVKITVFSDKTFLFDQKSPPASYFIKKAAKLSSGSKTPGLEMAGSVTMDQLRKIAEQKKADLNANDLDSACKILAGSARSMGITVEGQ
jgi:large subunit ribosomal protein L11